MLRLYCVLFFLSLAGCASGSHSLSIAKDDRSSWHALSPTSFGATLNANQVLRVAFAEHEATLNCIVAITPQQITLVGVTALGMRAFTVKFDGERVTADVQAGAPQVMPPERLINDLQFVYWPLAALQTALAHSDWQITEPAPFTRRLRHGARIIAEAHYASADPWSGRAWLANFEFGYTLNIESQRMAAVAQ